MNFFKRAVTSITRKPGKTLILLVLVFILGNVIAGSFSIQQSVKNTEAAAKKRIFPIVTLEQNWNFASGLADKELADEGIVRPEWDAEDFDQVKMDEYWNKQNEKTNEISRRYALTAEKVEELGALPMVDFFDYFNTAGLQSKLLRKYIPEDIANSEYLYTAEEGDSEYFEIRGSRTEDLPDLKMGSIELVGDGSRPFTKEEVDNGEYTALISEGFAQQNNLQVGETFTLNHDVMVMPEMPMMEGDGDVTIARGGMAVERTVTMDGDYKMDEPEVAATLDFEFTVTGIYKPEIQPEAPNNNDEWQKVNNKLSRNNLIYTSNNAIKKIQNYIIEEEKAKNPNGYYATDEYAGSEYIIPIFAFKDNDAMYDFADEIKKMEGDGDEAVEQIRKERGGSYYINDNKLDYDNTLAPLKNMSWLANIILFEGIGASLIILSLLITLFLRDRRSEIGIYLAIGERKRKVMAQILVEILLVSVIGITLSVFSGNLLSDKLSTAMIENQIQEEQKKESRQLPTEPTYENNQLARLGFAKEVTLEEITQDYDVKLDANIILIFYAGGLITLLLSTVIPLMYVLRLNPRKILM